MCVSLWSSHPLNITRTIGHVHAVDFYRGSNLGRFSKLSCYSPDSLGRNRGYFFHPLGGIFGSACLEQLKGRPRLLVLNPVLSFQRRLFQRRVVICFYRCVTLIVQEGLFGGGIAHEFPIEPHQIAGVGVVLEELGIVDLEFIQQDIQYPESKGGISPRTGGEPFVCLGCPVIRAWGSQD